MSTSSQRLHHELKRNFVIQRLEQLGIRKTREGIPIHSADYDTLKYELVMAEFTKIDSDHEANKWF